MKTIQITFKPLYLLLILGLVFTSCSSDDDSPANDDAIVDSLFRNDAEGWTIVGDAQGGFIEASYSPDGGIIEGYIYADDDVTGGVWYFSSPNSYHGNKQEYYGATLKYSLFQNSNMSNQFAREDIIFKSDEQQIYYEIATYPTADWTNYSVKIDESSAWRYGTFEGENTLATKAQIKEVLSNVTDFWIRGEFESGSDDGGLDKVEIIAE
ncbi:MAG: laminin B domain-containing protein [Mesonia sp.]|uniref:laminin B domain-containing protein n=1 Tax=Mesonia sp. TaxID=1960830 RepID=UPI003F980CD5